MHTPFCDPLNHHFDLPLYIAVPDSGLILSNANASLSFLPGKTYRLRVINMSGFSTFSFSIDNHTLDVIEVDGVS